MATSLYRLIFAAVLAVFAEAGVIDKCDLKAALEPSKVCGEVISFGLNSTQIQEILDAHKSNSFEPLKWSHELAAQAQAFVNQCQNSSNPCFKYSGSQASTKSLHSTSELSLTKMINWLFGRDEDSMMPHMDVPIFHVPDIENEISDLEIPDFKMPTIDVLDFDIAHIEIPDIFHISRRRRSSTDDYTDMVGCGYIAYKKQGGVLEHLMCYYGPRGTSDGVRAR